MAGTIFSYNIRALESAGLLLPDSNVVTIRQKLWLCFVFILYAVIFILKFIYFALKDESTLTENIVFVASMVGAAMMAYRQIYFTLKLKEITSLVTELEGGSDSLELNILEIRMRPDTKKLIHRLSIWILGFNLALIFFSISRSIIALFIPSMQRVLIFEVWFPWDTKFAPTFTFLLVWQAMATYTGFRTSAATDAFACSLMLAVSRRCELLARAAPQALLPAANDTATTPYCKAWIKYHQQYIGLVADINKLMGPFMLITSFVSAIHLTLFTYLSVRVTNRDDNIICVTYLVMVMFRLFTFAYAGQQVQNKSVQLGRSVLGARQVARAGLKAGPMRTTLQVIMARCCKVVPEEINAMEYSSVSMDMFAFVLRSSVTFILCLLQLKSRGA